MKACLFLLAVLAALVACNDAAAVQNAAARANMQQGTYRPGDRLLHRCVLITVINLVYN